MFTGIITDIGTIRSVERRGDLRVVIGTDYDVDGVMIGASIACSGACLTVVDKGHDAEGNWFAVDISGESTDKTAPVWVEGGRLNLERALKVGDELGGHIVTGHVDGVGEVVSVTPEGDSWRVMIAAPVHLAKSIAEKGSITVDGVSLTVNAVEDQADGRANFGLNIIPHTRSATTFDALAPGRKVNLEIDILARYLARMQGR